MNSFIVAKKRKLAQLLPAQCPRVITPISERALDAAQSVQIAAVSRAADLHSFRSFFEILGRLPAIVSRFAIGTPFRISDAYARLFEKPARQL